MEKKEDDNKRVLKYPLWKLATYFIIYSVIGWIIETIFGLLTKGVIESRQSMLYGPFCNIYGVGAICLLCIPNSQKKNNYQLFWSGWITGSLVEYFVSWGGEAIYNVKWWDYSTMPFNINGRICLLYSIMWGGLTIVLTKIINPKIDEYIDTYINKFSLKKFKIFVLIVIVFMAIDQGVSSFAMKMFYTKVIHNNNIEHVKNVDYYEQYLNLYSNNDTIKKIVDTFFNDEKMLKTFPNLKLTLENGKIILVRDILKDIKPYYIRVFTPKFSHKIKEEI